MEIEGGLSVCPVIILRVAGSPARLASQLRPIAYCDSVDAYYQDFDSATVEMRRVCLALEAYCPMLTDAKAIHALINTKRSLFNMRRPRAGELNAIGAHLPSRLHEQLEKSVVAIEQLAERRASIQSLHSAALQEAERALDAIAMSPGIRDTMSSYVPALYEKLYRHESKSIRAVPQKEARAIRATVLNYILRGALKTSPHSSLGLTALAKLTRGQGADPCRHLDLGPGGIGIATRLRHAPIQQVYHSMLHSRNMLDPAAPLQLNPSLRRTEHGWSWGKILYNEAAADRVFGVNQAIVHLPNRPIITLLINAFGEDSRFAPRPLDELIGRLHTRLPEASWTGIERALGDAIGQELLLPVAQAGAQEDILLWARRATAILRGELTTDLEVCLADMENALVELDSCAADQRSLHYPSISSAFARLSKLADIPSEASSFEPLIHDDWRLQTPPILIGLDSLAQPLADLTSFARLFPLIEAADGRPMLATIIKSAFIGTYGRDGVCDDVEGFLGSIPDGVLFGAAASHDPDSPEHLLQEQSLEFMGRLARRAEGGGELKLDPSEIAKAHALMPDCFRARPRSHCVHLQCFEPDESGLRVVLNQIFPGNARMMSRFLTAIDTEAIADVRAYVASRDENSVRVAVPGVFGFNANLHIPLTDTEFDLPPYDRDHLNVSGLCLNEVQLRYDPPTNRLQLSTRDGRRLSPQFFGILVPQRMPRLHQMLDAIGDNSNGITPLARLIGERLTPGDDGVICIPRISVGSVVVCRATIIAPITAFPHPASDDAVFFLELQSWRRRHDLPSQVFYQRPRDRRIASAFVKGTSSESSAYANQPWKSAKPMFLDFNNPLCVREFRKSLAKRSEAVLIAEALPTPNMAVARIRDDAHIMELAVELRWERQS